MYVGMERDREWNLSMLMNNIMSGLHLHIYRRGVSVEGSKGGKVWKMMNGKRADV